jgi:hypothetical protein
MFTLTLIVPQHIPDGRFNMLWSRRLDQMLHRHCAPSQCSLRAIESLWRGIHVSAAWHVNGKCVSLPRRRGRSRGAISPAVTRFNSTELRKIIDGAHATAVDALDCGCSGDSTCGQIASLHKPLRGPDGQLFSSRH